MRSPTYLESKTRGWISYPRLQARKVTYINCSLFHETLDKPTLVTSVLVSLSDGTCAPHGKHWL